MKTTPRLLLASVSIVSALLLTSASAQTTVSITATDAAAAETWAGQSPCPGSIRVSRTGSTTGALNVWVKVTGTALRNSDYTFGATVGAYATIPAGSAHLDVPVNVQDDATAEVAETVRIDLEEETSAGTPVPYTISSSDRAEVTISDNESLLQPMRISVAALSNAGEGSGGATVPGTFRFSRTGNLSTPVTVGYSIQGTATAGADYAALSGSVSFAANQSEADVTVSPVDDAVLEGNETVAVAILASVCSGASPPAADCYAFGSPNTAQLTIADNEVPPVRAVVSVSALNNASESPTSGAFQFARSANLDVALTVNYTVGGTATSGTDYAALSGSVAIPAGVETVTVQVSPVDDTVLEAAETVTLTIQPSTCPGLYPPSECYLVGASGSASLTIADNEIAPVVSVTASQNTNFAGLPAVGQGSFTAYATNGHIAAYQVRVDGVQQFYHVINHATPPTPGTPFTASFALTNLPAGNRNVQVTAFDNLSNGGTGTTSLTITNIPMPSVFQAVAIDDDASETLPGEPPNTGRIRFTMIGNMDLGIWDWGFGGTARINSDYTLAWDGGTLTTNGNVLTWTTDAVVTPIDDQIVEPTETMDLQACFVIIAWIYGVGAPIGTECSSFGAPIYIRDNDTISPFPVARISASDADAAEVSTLSGNAQNPGAFTFTRTAPATNDLSVFYNIGGTAKNGTDYSALSGVIVIPNGTTSATLPVLPLYDTLLEGAETVTLSLRPSPTGNYLLDPGQANTATVNIRDFAPTNVPVIRIKVIDSMAFEMPSLSPHAVVRVERSANLAGSLTVPMDISGTAVNGLDYVALPNSVTFSNGVSFQQLTVIPYLDGETNEPDETVIFTLAQPSASVFPPPYLLGATGLAVNTAAVTIREDAIPLGPPRDRFERARRLRFPGRYRIVPLPTLPAVPAVAATPASGTNQTTLTTTVTWAVEASSDLKNWEEIGVTEDLEEFVDVTETDAPQRFYRFRQVIPAAL